MCTIAGAKVQLNYNCYNVYFYECLPLLTALMFEFYFLVIVKLLIFSELTKHRGLFYSYFMLNYAGAPSLAKL